MPVRQNPLIASSIPAELLNLLQSEGIPYQVNADIRPYTTIKIGGNVAVAVEVGEERHLRSVVGCLGRLRLPVVLIGGGSNVVFSDGFSPLVVIVNRTRRIELCDGRRLRIESGAPIRGLLGWCIKNRIGGLEFLAGIPGSVGGAAAVNAGAFGRSISQVLLEAEVVDVTGEIKSAGSDEFAFSYRNSRFKTGDRIISAVHLQGKEGDPGEIRAEIRRLILHRKERHPSSNRYTAGCFFKNPTVGDDRISAGKIIADLGYLGKRFKNVGVSSTHGNFLINTGGGTCEDIQALERHLVESVREQTNIGLEREVIYISPDGEKY